MVRDEFAESYKIILTYKMYFGHPNSQPPYAIPISNEPYFIEPPPYSAGTTSERVEKTIIEKQAPSTSIWKGIFAGVSTFTILEVIRNIFF